LTGKSADKVDGVDIPATIAEVLTNHNKEIHDALKIAVDAVDVVNVPAGNIEAVDIQSAINELDTEKLPLVGGALTGPLKTHKVTLANIITIDIDDTTPSVLNGNIFKTQANTGSTVITTFDDGLQGQIIVVIGGSNTNPSVISSEGAIVLKRGNLTLKEGKSMTLVYDGASWIELSRSNVTPEYACIVDKQGVGTGPGTFASGDWRTRTLTTVQVNDGNHASLSNNQITLDAGTYEVNISCPARRVNNHQARLYNITDGAVALVGSSSNANEGNYVLSHSFIKGRITITAQKVFEIQHICKTTGTFGTACGWTDEIYTIAEFRRVVEY